MLYRNAVMSVYVYVCKQYVHMAIKHTPLPNVSECVCAVCAVSASVYLAWCPQGPAHSGKGWGEGWWHLSPLPEAQTLWERDRSIISDWFRSYFCFFFSFKVQWLVYFIIYNFEKEHYSRLFLLSNVPLQDQNQHYALAHLSIFLRKLPKPVCGTQAQIHPFPLMSGHWYTFQF